MAETTVYFATNRRPSGTNGFGAHIVPPDVSKMTYGSIHVTNIALPDAASGKMGPIMDRSMGSFAANSLTAIVNGGENLLVFIHGFDNSFADAIKRAAYNRAWFADGGAIGATSVVAFTWPSLGQLLAKKPTSLTSGYLADQGHAGASGFHIAKFFLEIDKLEKAFRIAKPNGRIFLLAHSMGNWALQAGIASWFQQRESNDVVFDEVFLAAPDERFDTFAAPAGQRLSRLKDIGHRITIYYSEMDTIIWLSNGINGILRLGFAGPGDKTDDTQFPPAKYRMRDCGGVFDYDCFDGFDASHQYYRKSPKVRADIVAIMSGAASGAKIAAL
jgi:esterase/lipase superfamily enzyme